MLPSSRDNYSQDVKYDLNSKNVDSGCKLPKKYEDLCWMVETLDGHLHVHKQRKGGLTGTVTLHMLTEMFKNANGRAFDQQKLAEICAVSPDLFGHKWELQKGEYQLVVDISDGNNGFQAGMLNQT